MTDIVRLELVNWTGFGQFKLVWIQFKPMKPVWTGLYVRFETVRFSTSDSSTLFLDWTCFEFLFGHLRKWFSFQWFWFSFWKYFRTSNLCFGNFVIVNSCAPQVVKRAVGKDSCLKVFHVDVRQWAWGRFAHAKSFLLFEVLAIPPEVGEVEVEFDQSQDVIRLLNFHMLIPPCLIHQLNLNLNGTTSTQIL